MTLKRVLAEAAPPCAAAETAIGRFDLTKVVIRHRIGFVPAAEASIVVRVESARRSAAFSATQWIMDELKQTVPIWKHPVFKDGGSSSLP